MSQKITVECSTCHKTETYDTEKSLVIVWTEKRLGVIIHDIDTADYLKAIRLLVAKHKASIQEDRRNVTKN